MRHPFPPIISLKKILNFSVYRKQTETLSLRMKAIVALMIIAAFVAVASAQYVARVGYAGVGYPYAARVGYSGYYGGYAAAPVAHYGAYGVPTYGAYGVPAYGGRLVYG